MRERFVRAAGALAALVLTGCAAMPSGGAVHVGRVLPGPGGLSDLDVRVLPPSWHLGLAPDAVVTGFLRATVNSDDDYAIARSYLTGAASNAWHPSAGVTTYDDSGLELTETAPNATTRAIQLRAPRIGHIDQRGDYEPTPGSLLTGFTVTRSGGSWHLDRVPEGVLLSASDAQRTFRAADVYYLNRNGTTLVPEQILLENSQRGVATALVAALLSGPSSWLAPAARAAAPPRTTLIGNVPVHDNGVADVNLSSSIHLASPTELAEFSAQVVWTLRQVADVTAVRLLAEGAPLSVPGVPARQPMTSWARFDPAAPSASDGVLYVDHGHLAATGGDAAALARSDPGRVRYVGQSRDGETLAVVQTTDAGVRLLTGRVGHRLRPAVSGTTMTPPTFDVDGDVVTVVTGGGRGRRVVAVAPSGAVRTVSADAAIAGRPVTALQISRDGARVAAVVGAGRLLVGRVAGEPGTPAMGGFRDIAPGLGGVEGVTWASADDIVVTAAAPLGQRQIIDTDADGYATRQISLDRMQGLPVDVTGAPGQPLVAVTDNGMIWADVEGWRRIARGTVAVHSG